ncbi:Alpha/beta hydrolase, putative [Brugia malayi]|uniref:Alpha/beta hydrolase, putative n=1 Tax=Brugia malayi TaxID=6279 RepID=A0A0J9XPH4_BRUMA|nr:Alpha/beta hydrolase, putative [Brugia malayi]CDP92407.1 Bm8972 [Brugia malayi]VIO94966.1 Alpha/beta hydrolase, putative [Brugia malayi]
MPIDLTEFTDDTNNEKDSICEIMESITTIDEQKIGYCRYGRGEHNMLFICGGVGCYKKDFPEKVLNAFNPKFCSIVCIDPPGYGTSRPPNRRQEVNRCMKDAPFCIKLMQQLNLTPFTVLGWSEGCRTAIHVAARGKQLVNNMILLSAATRIDSRAARVTYGMRNTDQWLPDTMKAFLPYYPEEFVKKQWTDLCNVIQQVYDLLGGRFPSDYILPSLKIPVLVLNGGMDRFCNDPKYFATVIPNCKLDGHFLGGHDFHIKYPRWFADHVSTFLKESGNHCPTN